MLHLIVIKTLTKPSSHCHLRPHYNTHWVSLSTPNPHSSESLMSPMLSEPLITLDTHKSRELHSTCQD